MPDPDHRPLEAGDRCTRHGQPRPCSRCAEIADRLRRAEATWLENAVDAGRSRFERIGIPLDALKGMRVLEVAAGYGELLRFLQSDSIDAIGVDIKLPTRRAVLGPAYEYLRLRDQDVSEDAISIDVEVVPEDLRDDPAADGAFPIPGFAVGDYERLPIRGRSVDAVVGVSLGSGVVSEAALRELSRVLVPGGAAHLHAAVTEQSLRHRIAEKRGIAFKDLDLQTVSGADYDVALEQELDRIRKTLGPGWAAGVRRVDDSLVLDLHAPAAPQ